jgi:hypothetical protein
MCCEAETRQLQIKAEERWKPFFKGNDGLLKLALIPFQYEEFNDSPAAERRTS